MWELGQKLEGPRNFLELGANPIFLVPSEGLGLIHVESMSGISSATQMLSTSIPSGPVEEGKDKVNNPCMVMQYVLSLQRESLAKV